MSSFRPLKILCEVTKRQGSTFFNARNYCRDRGVEEKLLNLHKTNFVENAHEPKTNPQYLSPPEAANTGWWSFWGGGTKVMKSNLIPPPQDKIFTCAKSDTPDTTVSVESKPLLSWYATTWVSFLNKFGIQQGEETERNTLNFPGQEQAVCETRDDGLHSFTPYMGNDQQLCVNQTECLSLQDVELSQLCNKSDNTFQIVERQQSENQANLDVQDAPVLPTQIECTGSLPHRHIKQLPQYSKKVCSGQVQYRPFLKVRDLDSGVPSRFYSTDPNRPNDLKPLPTETLASMAQPTPPIENKSAVICSEKPSKLDTDIQLLAPSEPPLGNLESQAAVGDSYCLSMIVPVAEKPTPPTTMEASPPDTKHTPQLEDSTSRDSIAPEMPSPMPEPATTDSVKSPTMCTTPKTPSSNISSLPISNTQSPLPEAIKKDPLPSSQTPPTNVSSLCAEVAMPKVKKKPPSMHKQQPSSKSDLSPTKALDKEKNVTHTLSQTPDISESFPSVTKLQPVKAKTQEQFILEQLHTPKPYSSTSKTLNKGECKTCSVPERLIPPKTFSDVIRMPSPKVKIKQPSTPRKLPPLETLPFNTGTFDNAKNRTQTKLQNPSSKLPLFTSKTPVSEFKKPSISVKVPVAKTMSPLAKTLQNAKNRTQTQLHNPSSKVPLFTSKTPVSEVKKKPSLISVKVPVSKTVSSPAKTLENAKRKTQTKLHNPSSKASLFTSKTPVSEVKKKPSLISVTVAVSKTMSPLAKTLDNAKRKTQTKLQKPSSKASPFTSKTPVSEVKKKPSLISVKVPVSKTMSSPAKTLGNAKTRTQTKLQKLTSSKGPLSTTKTPVSEIKKKPSLISLKVPVSKTMSSPSKTLDNAKNRPLTKFKKTSSNASSSTTKTPLSEVKKKLSLIPPKLPAPRSLSHPSKPMGNVKNRTLTKLQKVSMSKVLFPTTKASLSEVKKRSGTRTFPPPSKILSAKNSPLTNFQNSSASKAFSSSSKAILNKTKQISQLVKTPKHVPQYDKQTPSSFAHIASTTKRFSSSTKATLSHSKTVQTLCGKVAQRSDAFCSTTTTELRNRIKMSPSVKKVTSSKSFSSVTQASISKLNEIATSRTKTSYSAVNKSTKTYPLPDVGSSEVSAEALPSPSSKKKPPSSHKEQSSSSGNTSVEPASSKDSTPSGATSDEKDPLKHQSVSGVNKVKDQSHCRRRPGECLPLPKHHHKSLIATRPEAIRVCPPKTIKKEASCKGLRLPGCVMPTSISCLRHTSPERKPCNKVLAPQPSFSECIRQMPKPPFPTECCTSERYRYLQPSEPMFFLRSTTISPPVIEPYIDPCKGECCTPATTARDAGDGDSLSSDTMGKKSTRDLAKAAVYDCLFQGKKLVLPGCARPKSTVCTATVATRAPCTRPLAPVPAFSECYKQPFPKRRNTECRVAAQRAIIMADVLSRGLRLTLDAIFEARCKKPGLTKTCEHHEEDQPCGPTSPPRDCAKEPPKSRPNRSCTEKVVEKCHAVPYKMSD